MTEKKERIYFNKRQPLDGVTYQLPGGESVTMYCTEPTSKTQGVQSTFWLAWGREMRRKKRISQNPSNRAR